MAIKRITGALSLLLALASQPVMAGNLDVLLSGIFPDKQATYIGYESIEREDIPATSAVERKYLIVDFRFESEHAGSMCRQHLAWRDCGHRHPPCP